MKKFIEDVIKVLEDIGAMFTFKNIAGMVILLNIALVFLSLFAMVWVDLAFLYFFARFVFTLFGILFLVAIIEKINETKL